MRVLRPALRAALIDLFDKAVAKRSRAVRRRFDHCGGATFQADKFVDSVYKSRAPRRTSGRGAVGFVKTGEL